MLDAAEASKAAGDRHLGSPGPTWGHWESMAFTILPSPRWQKGGGDR